MSLFIAKQFMESDDAGHTAIESDENEFTFRDGMLYSYYNK